MKTIITKTLITTFIFFIILSFLLMNSYKESKIDTDTDNDNIQQSDFNNNLIEKRFLFMYDIIAFIFLFLLLFFIYYNGYSNGCIKSLFIWAFFVACTPVPEAGLLFSLPLKKYFNISMHISQFIVSLLALFILLYFYKFCFKEIKKYQIGELFINLINFKYYSIIILSIISSTLISDLIDNIINNYLIRETINFQEIKIFTISLFVVIYSFLLNSLINKINSQK